MSLENVSIVPLKDVVKRVKVGFVGSCNNDYCSSDEGVPMIRTTNLTTEGIKLENLKYINNTFHIAHKKSQLHFGDILIARHGHNGLASLWEYKFDAQCLNVVVVEPDESLANRYYLTYLINSPLIQKQIKSLTGGSVQSVINTKDIADLLIPIPSLDKQKEIADFISLFNKKISVCKSINKNLEEQLLRIFDSWFLKFELSNEFSDSKLGLIPKGWKIDYLGSKKSCSIIKSGIDEFDNSKIYIATADVDNSIITSNDTLITMDDKPSRANMQPISNSIWFAKMIDSKKLIMVDEYCNDLLNNYIFSTGFCGLKCVDKYFYYLWTFLLTDVFDVMKNNFCTGTTMQAINNKDTKLIEFVLPDDKTITQFNSIAKPMFKKIYYNNLEIKKLQRLRDTLLPKLMSGEIDVSKINCDLKIIIRKIYIKSSKLFLWRYLSENQNYIKNTKSNETLLKSRTIYQINKFLAKFNARYRYYRQ